MGVNRWKIFTSETEESLEVMIFPLKPKVG